MNRREALQALISLPAVKSIAVADVKANDVIVVECESILSDNTRAYIKAQLADVWPCRKIVVLDSVLKLRIARETP